MKFWLDFRSQRQYPCHNGGILYFTMFLFDSLKYTHSKHNRMEKVVESSLLGCAFCGVWNSKERSTTERIMLCQLRLLCSVQCWFPIVISIKKYGVTFWIQGDIHGLYNSLDKDTPTATDRQVGHVIFIYMCGVLWKVLISRDKNTYQYFSLFSQFLHGYLTVL